MPKKPKKDKAERDAQGRIVCYSGLEADLMAAGVKKQDVDKVLAVVKAHGAAATVEHL